MLPLATLSIYCLAIMAASMLGGYVPLCIRLTHARAQLLMSFVAGLMLGVSLLHLLPHAIDEAQSVDSVTQWMVGGFVAMFLLLRAFHFHQHEPRAHEVDEACPHEHQHAHGSSSVNWLGVAVGMSIHTLIDGVALAANVLAETEEAGSSWLAGVGTFLAIALHKPLDSLSITSVMTAGGWSPRVQHLANFAFSLMCPLGCALFLLGLHHVVERQHFALGCVLGLSAGVFLCIALADLMPEIDLHDRDGVRLYLALLLGLALAYGIHSIEPAHEHNHEHPHTQASGVSGE